MEDDTEEEITGCLKGETEGVSEGVSEVYSLSATLPQEVYCPPSAWGEVEDEEEEEKKEEEEEDEKKEVEKRE